MLLLILFGFVAGAATAVSPCVLPVLPIALSAGATGGRRRPLGIVAGLVVSFTFAIVALVYVIDALGLPGDLLRKIAIVVLLGFGLLLLAPPLAARVEAFGSRFAGRVPTPQGGDGFWSGTVVGASLGLVYAPCAGPILAGVITVTASQPFTAGRLAVAIAYGIGSAAALYLLMIGGRRLVRPLARRGGALQIATGAVMVLVALAMLGNYDTSFESSIGKQWASWLTTPAESIEKTGSAKSALASISGVDPHGLGTRATAGSEEEATAGSEEEEITRTPPSELAAKKMKLPVYGQAPEFADTERWFNTPGGMPLTLKQLRGKVVLVDFWTYSCVNCIRTLPYLNAWYKRYHRDGFVIVGVHTPEFPFEREAGNVEAAIKREGIHYPVVQDNEEGTWDAYGNLYWPAEYFLDANGEVRFADAGEGEYEKKEDVIRELLAEDGKKVGRARSGAHGIEPSDAQLTPETYLGPYRAERNANGEESEGLQSFTQPSPLALNEWSLGGRWQIDHESITARSGSTLRLSFQARRVYLVLGSPGGARSMQVFLDGQPITATDAGEDVHGGVVTVKAQRLYQLVELPRVEHHVLELRPEAGIMGYAFTFG
ncbi:MAG TPA: cytochrome c biogenesis protein DipZ [Solirubrobacterales bacterium]|jgi:cytochrome c biogenesis protein CcdA/thiol-disulfide isomerase/thioredoxin